MKYKPEIFESTFNIIYSRNIYIMLIDGFLDNTLTAIEFSIPFMEIFEKEIFILQCGLEPEEEDRKILTNLAGVITSLFPFKVKNKIDDLKVQMLYEACQEASERLKSLDDSLQKILLGAHKPYYLID